MTNSHLNPGSTVGILGGGQLGRMLSLAAARLGFNTHIYSPEPHCPAKSVSALATTAKYSDKKAIAEFARSVDIVTFEFENIPIDTAVTAAVETPLYPPIEALFAAQDRLTEKEFISDTAGVPVAPYHPVNNAFDAVRALKILGEKIVLKTRRLGYDGKGQSIVTNEDDAKSAYKFLGEVPCIAEQFIPFRREVSVIAARGLNGEVAAYPLIENEHRDHILHKSICPALGDGGDAQTHAIRILENLDYVGVIAVEFFELDGGKLIVNEIAPRVHNSGHWSMDAGCIDQFELHIRAITGWPLGGTNPPFKVEMINLIGDDVKQVPDLAKSPYTKIHLYGKSEIRPGRKMGHFNRLIF
ncbi:MAG: 5-(carboxyamino)imidazole ribonucleotide synthase [Hellea sp.]|nr:5-(carboxyamino)imidazole ribonucleotide synthase [Hellea sp.]